MADSPKEAEAAQALFCAMADFVGKSDIDKVFDLAKLKKTQKEPDNIKTKLYDIWKSSNFIQVGKPKKNMSGTSLIKEAKTYIDTPSVSLVQMEKFLNNDSWFESSVLTAVKLVKEISTIDSDFKGLEGPGWDSYFYIRGAKADKSRAANTMENVEALFKIANKNNPQFGDVNKWSPADIYFVTSKAASDVAREIHELTDKSKKGSASKQSIFTFDDLNKLANGLIKSGDMLPLSLKKVSGSANLVKYNFKRSKEEKYFASILYDSVSQRTDYEANFSNYYKKLGKKYSQIKPVTRDIKIYFSPDQKEKIKIRHDLSHPKFGASKAIKVEIEVTGAGGRGGSFVGMDRLVNIIASVDKSFGSNLNGAWTTGLSRFEIEVENLNKKYGVTKSDSHSVLKNQPIAITNEWNIKTNKPKEPFGGQNMYEQYKIERIHIAGVEVDNRIYSVIQGYFDANDNEKNINFNSKIIAKFVEYASSRSQKSGMFVIAK